MSQFSLIFGCVLCLCGWVVVEEKDECMDGWVSYLGMTTQHEFYFKIRRKGRDFFVEDSFR